MIPDVPRRASQTIHGTIKVPVRVNVDPQGNVLGARTEKTGTSRYFDRLALEASKQWTFTPVATEGERFVRVQFNFSRSGTTARATPVK